MICGLLVVATTVSVWTLFACFKSPQELRTMSDLAASFDAATVDTRLAQEYLKKHKSEFRPIGAESTSDHVLDSYNNKIYKTVSKSYNEEKFPVYFIPEYTESNTDLSLLLKFKDLARKLEENIDLFCQLEFLIRNIPTEVTRSCTMKLIIQHLKHFAKCPLNGFGSMAYHINISSSLCVLGCVAWAVRHSMRAILLVDKNVAVVCSLFTELCHQVGLDSVLLQLYDEDKPLNDVFSKVTDFRYECMGVITERSDLDSAVDALLSSPTTFPWELRSLYIQESIYERFEKVLEWKCKSEPNNPGGEEQPTLSRRIMSYKQTTILLDYAGDDGGVGSQIGPHMSVEAYRTTKELLTLIRNRNPFGLSLWCSDLSEANEICFSIDVPTIWVNDVGSFDGPDRSSLSLYSHIYSGQPFLTDSMFSTQQDLRNAWLKRPLRNRIQMFEEALSDLREKVTGDDLELVKTLQLKVLDLKMSNCFLEVEGGRMCIMMNQPAGLVFAKSETELVEVLLSMVLGNVVLYLDESLVVLQELVKRKFPLMLCKYSHLRPAFDQLLYKQRTIRMHFGTIFAN